MNFDSIPPINIQSLGETYVFERPINREALRTIFTQYEVPQDGYGAHYWNLLSEDNDVRYENIKKFLEYPK